MSKSYVICSNTDCSFNKTNEHYSIKFCPLCGSMTFNECPHCNMPILERGDFCTYCGKNLKEPVKHDEDE